MKKFYKILACLFLSLNINSVSAALVDNGGGLIYDSVSNITWYDYRYTGFDQYGSTNGNSWGHAFIWASNLNLGGVSGWRLPVGIYSSKGQSNEIEQLFIGELHNSVYGSLDNSGPFSSFVGGDRYWLGPDMFSTAGGEKAWTFDLAGMIEKGDFYENFPALAIAVHDGDIGPSGMISSVPIPGAIWLFSSSIAGFFGILFKRSSNISKSITNC